ncbi:MAG: TlpA disulfide reductase family protein [Bacteroidales bacterium]|nr:TlpA disulfide reductase family protein [Bacteroidales bacterium]
MIANHKYTFLFLSLLMIFSKISSQTISLTIPCTDTIPTVYLTDYWGDRFLVLDSAHRNEAGKYVFNVPEKGYPSGLYSIRFTKEARFDLILNHEKNIEIELCPDQMLETVSVKNSIENEVYYQFIKKNMLLERSVSVLDAAILRYPKEDLFYDTLVRKYVALQETRHREIDQIEKWYPKSFVTKIVRMYRTPILDAGLSSQQQINILRENFFYGLSFSDADLLRSNVYPNKILELLQLYADPNFSQAEFEEAMKTASGRLLSVSSENQEVFSFVRDYLIAGFESYQLHDVLDFIEENYLQPSCDDGNKNRLSERMAAFDALKIGMKAPVFAVRNQDGDIKELSEIETPTTIILFYASTCSHCFEVVGRLWDQYKSQKNKQFEVIAISLDQNERAWEDYMDLHRFTWINTFSPQGFDGSVTNAYHVYTTPMMFVLDQQKNIVAKPMNWKELKTVLKDLK